MKKVWKAGIAGLAALSIGAAGFFGTSAAFAAVEDNATVTFSGFHAGDVVTPYKILNLESETTDEHGNTKYVYSVNAANKAAVIAGMNAIKAQGAADIASTVSDADLIKAVLAGLKSDNVEKFATAFKTAGPTASDTIDTASADIQQGYYLFDLSTVGQPNTTPGTAQYTKSRYMVDTVGSNGVTITIKNGSVTLTKKVQDNLGETEPGNVAANGGWNDSADYALGDTVPFQLTGTLPKEYGEYEEYYYQFVDTMSAGLTYSGDKNVTIVSGTTNLKSCFEITSSGNGPTTINFTASNLKTCKAAADLKAGDSIVVEYKATLNNQAVLGTAGNPNEAKLIFSNDPKQQGEGHTGVTPTDLVKVFTYDFQGTKTFSITPNDDDLPVFTLTNTTTNKSYTLPVVKKNGNYTFGVERIDAGVYKLEETYTPAGFNKAEIVEFTLTAVHDAVADNPTVTITVTPTVTGAASNTATGAQSTVVNTGGNKLPETGGMGTTVLYAAGAAIVLIAGIGLAVALRRRQA